jgi:hypothetical protein
MRCHFRGSWCPLCWQDTRFDDVQISVDKGDPGMLLIDVDHYYGALASGVFYDPGTKQSVWINIEQKTNHGEMITMSRSDIEKYGDFHGQDRTGVMMRASKTIAMEVSQESVSKIRKMFDEKKSVEDILAMRYTPDDIVAAGVDMDMMIKRGYTLKDMHNLGFKTYQSLLSLKMHTKLLELFHNTKKMFLPVKMLVEYYNINYQVLIRMFCYDFNGNIRADVLTQQRAVLNFCKLHFCREELIYLGLTNINSLISLFGPHCFNADCLVELCRGDGMNNVDVLMDEFKFDSDTMAKISGFMEKHLKKLNWDKSHPLRISLKMKRQQKETSSESDDYHQPDEPVIERYETSDSSSEEVPQIVEQKQPEPVQRVQFPSSSSTFEFEALEFSTSSLLPTLPKSSASSSSSMVNYDTDSTPRGRRRPGPTKDWLG